MSFADINRIFKSLGFFVTLTSPKIVTLENTQIYLVFRSLICTFAAILNFAPCLSKIYLLK